VYALNFGAQGIGYGALVFVFSAMQFLANGAPRGCRIASAADPSCSRHVINAVGYSCSVRPFLPGAASSPRDLRVREWNISAAQAYMADITSRRSGPAHGVIGPRSGSDSCSSLIGGLRRHYLGHLRPGSSPLGCRSSLLSASVILRESLPSSTHGGGRCSISLTWWKRWPERRCGG